MTISVEYLAIVRRADSFCDSAESFERLLQVDSNIKLTGSEIQYQGARTCEMQVAAGEVAGKDQRYFHLHFTCDDSVTSDHDALARFLSFLKAVRTCVAKLSGETETLQDDISAHYGLKAYPYIHEVENLMRRLIAHFMLVNVGREWALESLPGSVADALRNSRRSESAKSYVNVLHTLDFIHLGEFLFNPYPKRPAQELFGKLKEIKTSEEAASLHEEYAPQSNWKRYFSGIVPCNDSYLDSRWKKLYELRCKVAHNNLITAKDLEEIEVLVGEVKPKLQEAIAKLAKVKVPSEEQELVAERAASSVNAAVGEFISCWQELEGSLGQALLQSGLPVRRFIHSGPELVRRGALAPANLAVYESVRQFRNSIVHGPRTEVAPETIQAYVADVRQLLGSVENGAYVEYLRSLDGTALTAELDNLIANSTGAIVDSEAFAEAMAGTNASGFGVDGYEIEEVSLEDDRCVARITFSASGDHDDERMYSGDTIVGTARVVVDGHREMTYEDIEARIAPEPHDEVGSDL